MIDEPLQSSGLPLRYHHYCRRRAIFVRCHRRLIKGVEKWNDGIESRTIEKIQTRSLLLKDQSSHGDQCHYYYERGVQSFASCR